MKPPIYTPYRPVKRRLMAQPPQPPVRDSLFAAGAGAILAGSAAYLIAIVVLAVAR